MLYRIVVMGLAVLVGAMAWQEYGPPIERVIHFVHGATELADAMFVEGSSESSVSPNSSTHQPLAAGSVSSDAQTPISSSEAVQPTTVSLLPADGSGRSAERVTGVIRQPQSLQPSNSSAKMAQTDSGHSESVDQLIQKLTEQGMTEHEIARWGLESQLYRFSCRVSLADYPYYTRHFESVAPDPQTAVAQVAADVATWRSDQRR